MTSFHCFRDGKCEWIKGLQDFTSQFNKAFNKNYTLSKCLDVYDDKTKKQPEVLLESLGDKPIVIECKKIIYPLDYYKKHRHFHNLGEDFVTIYENKLKPHLSKDVYEFRVGESSFYEYSKRNKREILEQISSKILSHLKDLNTFGEISSQLPIYWYFRRVPNSERDNTSESGLILSSLVESRLTAPSTLKAEKVINDELIKHLSSAEQKFQGYDNCLKILILELCGDSFYIPSPDVIIEIVKNTDIPSNINQIWLADPQNEHESLIMFHQILS